jgi:hypothetical protein
MKHLPKLWKPCVAVGGRKSCQQWRPRRHLAYLLHRQICLQVPLCIGSWEAVIIGRPCGGLTVSRIAGRLVRFAFKSVRIVLW